MALPSDSLGGGLGQCGIIAHIEGEDQRFAAIRRHLGEARFVAAREHHMRAACRQLACQRRADAR